jgi:aminoglycoside/choline kinase family phosphotransferase
VTETANALSSLFAAHFGAPPVQVREVAADASSRSYFRLEGSGGVTAIGAFGPDPEENRAFLSFSRALRGAGLPVPAIYAQDEGKGLWLAEDLGDTTLLDVLSRARSTSGLPFPTEAQPAYQRTLERLLDLQLEGAKVVDFGVAYPRPAFDETSILWDLSYFKYHFLKLARVPFHEDRLEDDFRKLTRFLTETDTGYFLHRDFQARNVMVRDGEPWFIDYQGGRRGALQYDVASLLFSGSSDLPPDARESLLDRYLTALERCVPVDRPTWEAQYRGYALVRVMQAMGTYGYRGLFERKPRFVERVPAAARSAGTLLEGGLPAALPEIEGALRWIVDRWAGLGRAPAAADAGAPGGQVAGGPGLTVHLSSFSYRSGYPGDAGGHGGGFVFDCRALPNPGREARYQRLSGLDDDVVRHLSESADVAAFWENTRALVDAQVEDYLRRGFHDLSVAYGCTGGQHRSVYLVERIARHLRGRFPQIGVRVQHREAASWTR